METPGGTIACTTAGRAGAPALLLVHGLGGGVALQFAYQFPEPTQRLVLISSGGLGPEVSLMLRAATLPGAETVVAQLARIPEGITRRVLPVLSTIPKFLALEDTGPLAGILHGLDEPRSRLAFLRTARSVIDWRGQTVSALRRLHLLHFLNTSPPFDYTKDH